MSPEKIEMNYIIEGDEPDDSEDALLETQIDDEDDQMK